MKEMSEEQHVWSQKYFKAIAGLMRKEAGLPNIVADPTRFYIADGRLFCREWEREVSF